MKYRVSFFKASGKWYADEELVLPLALVRMADEYNAQGDWGKAIYEIREWVSNHIITEMGYKEMHAVVEVPEDDDYLGYPMLILADRRR